jgi:hypothetical protein
MSENRPDDARSRDDEHLQELVGEARAWMKAQGITETEPDWDAIAGQARALWWRRRLAAALTGLAARAQELPATIAATVRRLAAAAESRAEAAVEVTLDAAQRVGRVLFEPARECVGAEVRFARPGGVRTRGGGSPSSESVGILVTPALPGARVAANAAARTVTVEVPDAEAPVVVMLVPEDTEAMVLVKQTKAKDGVQSAEFEEVGTGAYLLSLYPEGVGLL